MRDTKTTHTDSIPDVRVEDFEDKAYILAFRDSGSSKVVTYHANHNNLAAMKYLLNKALDFFKKNCGFAGFEAKSHNVEGGEVRVITAINQKSNEREALYISRKYHRGANTGSFNVSDIAGAIFGLIAAGPLNFSEEVLLKRGIPQSESAAIMMAYLMPTAKKSSDDTVVNVGRHIVDIVSNDPFYMRLNKHSGPGTLYATTLTTSRKQKISKDDIAPSTKSESENIWITSCRFDDFRYFKYKTKPKFKQKYATSSLLLSANFFELYSRLSNKSFKLEVSQFRGVKDCYQVSVNKEPGSHVFDLIPIPDFELSVAKDRLLLKQDGVLSKDFNFSDLIAKGWEEPPFVNDSYYYNDVLGDFSKVVSYWLWVVLAHHYFDENPSPSLIAKGRKVFSSVIINRALVHAESISFEMFKQRFTPLPSTRLGAFLSTDTDTLPSTDTDVDFWEGFKILKDTGDIESAYHLEVTKFEAVGFVFSAGSPVFQILCNKEESSENSYWSLYSSDAKSGFFNNDSLSYTLIETDKMGGVKSVYCYALFSSAFKKIIEVIGTSSTAKANNMDAYDIVRSVSDVAKSFNCSIDIGFHLDSHLPWRLSSR